MTDITATTLRIIQAVAATRQVKLTSLADAQPGCTIALGYDTGSRGGLLAVTSDPAQPQA